MLRRQRLAVHLVGEQHLVAERLLERQRRWKACSTSALDAAVEPGEEHLDRAVRDADLVEQRPQRRAGPTSGADGLEQPRLADRSRLEPRPAVPGALHRHGELGPRAALAAPRAPSESSRSPPTHEPPGVGLDGRDVVVGQQVVQPDRRDRVAQRLERHPVVARRELELLEADSLHDTSLTALTRPLKEGCFTGSVERRAPDEAGPIANERLTATTAVVLIVLLFVEGVTILFLRPLLPVHIFVGMLLIPPVALKLATTGYRFVRYYTGAPAYLRRGPPHIVMRVLAPLLVAATLGVFSTGNRAARARAEPRARDRARAAQGELRRLVRGRRRARARLPASPAEARSRRRRATTDRSRRGLACGRPDARGRDVLDGLALGRPRRPPRRRPRSCSQQLPLGDETVKCTPARPSSEKPSAGPGETSSSRRGRFQRSNCSRSM